MDSKTESDLMSRLQSFNSTYQSMEELYDKLIVLNYSEQFYTFICLVAWLIKEKCGIQLKNDLNPDDYEDPNVYIYTILDTLRNIGKSVEFSPNKLKQGYGPEVIYILNSFADKALEKIEFPNQAQINILASNSNFDITQLDEKDENEYVEDDEEEDAKYLFENQQYTVIDDGDDENSLDEEELSGSLEISKLDGLSDYGRSSNRLNRENLLNMENKNLIPFKQTNKPMIRTNLDSKQWREEFEQMLPQLKLANRMLEESGNNWRIRFDELEKRNRLIHAELNQCNDGLGKLELDVQKSLDRLDSRERYVQQQMDALCNELLAYRSELDRSTENYQQINGGVISKSRRLAELNEQIQKLKNETEKREQSISDKTPLLQIKKVLSKLKTDIDDLNIRIGVALRNVMYQNLQKTGNKNEFNSAIYSKEAYNHLVGISQKQHDLRLVY